MAKIQISHSLGHVVTDVGVFRQIALFWCPACKTHMWFALGTSDDGQPTPWLWNRDTEKPTVTKNPRSPTSALHHRRPPSFLIRLWS